MKCWGFKHYERHNAEALDPELEDTELEVTVLGSGCLTIAK